MSRNTPRFLFWPCFVWDSRWLDGRSRHNASLIPSRRRPTIPTPTSAQASPTRTAGWKMTIPKKPLPGSKSENKVTFGYLNKISYRGQVEARLKAVANYPRYSAPFRRGENVFFYKNSGLQNQSVLYIQKGLEGTPEVLIDPNTFSSDGTIALRGFELSRDGRYAAYIVSAIPGSDWEEIRVLDVKTRKPLPDTLKWVKFSSTAWRGDGFYYSRYPQPPAGKELTTQNANQAVYYHKLGTAQAEDQLVYEDKAHPLRFVSVGTTEDERFALLYVSDNTKKGNALFFRDESKSDKTFTPIVSEITEERYSIVDNEGDKFLLQTTKDAPNQKIVLYDPANPDEKDWKTLLPERPEPLSAVETVGDKLIVSSLKDVTTQISVYSRDGKLENRIALPAPGTAGGFNGRRKIRMSSTVSPRSTIRRRSSAMISRRGNPRCSAPRKSPVLRPVSMRQRKSSTKAKMARAFRCFWSIKKV